jgi:hypothetical protein
VNDKATLERWKKGEEKLYNAHYYIRPLAVKNRRPSVKELSQATGIGTYAKGGEMFIDLESGDFRNQILFDPKEVREFQKYVFSYYGKNGTFVDVMEEGIPATTGEVLKAVSQYIAYLSSPKKSTDVTWGNGDSFDREIVRDIIKYNRNPRAIVEYPFLIKDMKKTPILEYGGILQPMIGGVNADPRFDIYNTTMFAEKGAEVPEGDEYGKGGQTKIYEVATRTKGKSGEFASSVRAKSKEDALRIYKEKHGDEKNKVIVDVYETTRKRLEDGGEMAKGGMVKEINFDGTNWYLTYIDPTHFFLSNDASFKGNPYHIGQFRARPFYNEIKEWLSSYKDTMAKGGKTHEQGYDDREDERLAMRHGKIASKDFVGSHKRREHSRRDDARFETRNK